MTTLSLLGILMAALAVAGLALATVLREVHSDGYGQRPPPASTPDQADSRAVVLSRLR